MKLRSFILQAVVAVIASVILLPFIVIWLIKEAFE